MERIPEKYQNSMNNSLYDKKGKKQQVDLSIEIKRMLLAAATGVVLAIGGMTLGPKAVDLGKDLVETIQGRFDEKERDEKALEIFTMLMNESGGAKRTENNEYHYYEHDNIANAIVDYVNWPLRNTDNYSIEELLEAGMKYPDTYFGEADVAKIAEIIDQRIMNEKNTLGGP